MGPTFKMFILSLIFKGLFLQSPCQISYLYVLIRFNLSFMVFQVKEGQIKVDCDSYLPFVYPKIYIIF